MNIIAKLKARRVEKQQKAKSDIQQIAACIANGEEPDVDFIDATLQSTGDTPEQLQARVTQELSRIALRAKVNQLPKLNTDANRVMKQLESLDQQLSDYQASLEEKMHPLRCQHQDLLQAIQDAEAAKRELQALNFDLADEAQKDTLRELSSNIKLLSTKLSEKRQFIDRVESEANSVKTRLKNLMPAGQKAILESELSKHNAVLERSRQSKDELEKAIAEAQSNLQKLERSILNS